MTAVAITATPRRELWRRFRRNRTALPGLVILAAILLLALLAPVLYPGDPFQSVGKPFGSPFGKQLFGTDMLGRDVAAGIAYGARASLLVGFVATLVALVLGTLIGGIAGFYGGLVGDVLMRLTEFFQTIPTFIFALVLVAVLSPSITNIVIAIAVVTWPPVARLVRGEFLAMRRREFVEACIVLGMRDAAIIFREILPNCLSPIIVTGSLMVATAILYRICPRLSRARRPQRHELGLHDRRRPNLPAHRVVAVRHPGTRHPAHGAGDQSGRRGLE